MFRANGDQEISKEGNFLVERRYCPGCGVLLQTEDPKAPGFLPIPSDGRSVCQRCYRILNYGRFTATEVSAHQSFEAIKTATAKADLTLLVADFFDPEGSFATRWDHLIVNDLMLVVNKADLIPPKTNRAEVLDWFREEWQRRFPHKPLVGLETISFREELKKTALQTFLTGKRVAFVGAANVGKTSLLLNLLGQRNQGRRRGEPGPVVSHYPGTTQGLLRWALKEERIEVLDTPGLIPGARMGDLLCPTCAARLLPNQRLQIKLWRLSPGEAVLFGDLAGIWNRSPDERMLVFFSSDRIKLHRTNGQKAEALLQASPDWLRATCANDPKNSICQREEFTVQPGEDLYISGLGWISAKKAPADLCLVVQKKAEVGIRPSLVGSRT